MDNLIFSIPDLTTFARLDTLDLTCISQHITARKAVLKCRPNTADDWCRRCGGHGDIRDTVLRRLAHEPFGHRPTTLHIRLRRYKCIECGHVWRQDTTTAAPVRAKTSRPAIAPGIEVSVLGGHTPGQAVVTVTTSEGPVVLASDAVHFHEELDRDMLFQSMTDLPQSYRAFEWLRSLPVQHVVSGHDAGELDRHAAMTGDLAGLAATIGTLP